MPKTVVDVTYSTLEQAETEVFRLIESKTNYRDICQIEFMINGIKKKFSLSQISKIKQKLSPKDNSNPSETKTESEQKAMLFELFQNKMTVIDVVIKTKLDSKLVNETFQEFTKLNDDHIIPEIYMKHLRKILYPIDKKYGLDGTEYDEPCNIITASTDYLTIFNDKIY